MVALNTAGLLAYLCWLVFRHHRILYSADGALYLLPCLPFFFVYLFIHERRHGEPDDRSEG